MTCFQLLLQQFIQGLWPYWIWRFHRLQIVFILLPPLRIDFRAIASTGLGSGFYGLWNEFPDFRWYGSWLLSVREVGVWLRIFL